MSDTAHGITAANILSALPSVLAKDESKEALAEATASVLAQAASDTLKVILYKNIDTMESELLDILANDFDVSWWSNDYTLAERRKTLKESWRMHRILGTKKAVELGVSAIYDDSAVVEWPSYSGQPYHFKIQIDAAYQGVDPDKYALVMERVNKYKNARSVLDAVEYVEMGCAALSYEGAACSGASITDYATAQRY